jgi:hypothetical protein
MYASDCLARCALRELPLTMRKAQSLTAACTQLDGIFVANRECGEIGSVPLRMPCRV